MSFRARLRLFFVLIVIVPMLSVAIVLFRLISDNETGKADADIAARQRAAISLYRESRREADGAVVGVGADRVLSESLQSGDGARARRRAGQLLASRGIDHISLTRNGRVFFDVGHRDAIAPAQRELRGVSGRRFGVLEASTTRSQEYARTAHRIIGVDVAVLAGRRVLADTLHGPPPSVPEPGEPEDVSYEGDSYRAVSYRATDFNDKPVELALLAPDAQRDTNVGDARLLAGGILLGFLVLALTFALAVSR